MKLKDLIEKLQETKEKYGNLPVVTGALGENIRAFDFERDSYVQGIGEQPVT